MEYHNLIFWSFILILFGSYFFAFTYMLNKATSQFDKDDPMWIKLSDLIKNGEVVKQEFSTNGYCSLKIFKENITFSITWAFGLNGNDIRFISVNEKAYIHNPKMNKELLKLSKVRAEEIIKEETNDIFKFNS